mmetsp:Transcript_3373/g.4651  ORF Transcript_3373/g.4651 Transcript_3373/m.4651 type:complete len:233 (-) Transcript_3373:671-1369(-)
MYSTHPDDRIHSYSTHPDDRIHSYSTHMHVSNPMKLSPKYLLLHAEHDALVAESLPQHGPQPHTGGDHAEAGRQQLSVQRQAHGGLGHHLGRLAVTRVTVQRLDGAAQDRLLAAGHVQDLGPQTHLEEALVQHLLRRSLSRRGQQSLEQGPGGRQHQQQPRPGREQGLHQGHERAAHQRALAEDHGPSVAPVLQRVGPVHQARVHALHHVGGRVGPGQRVVAGQTAVAGPGP